MASKERERAQFEPFADAIGRPELKGAQDSESPDFVFDEGGRRLGIDLAEIFFDRQEKGGSPTRREETEFSRFRTGVQQGLKQRWPTAPVTVGWEWVSTPRAGSGRQNTDLAIQALLKLIEEALPTLPEHGEKTLWVADTPDPVPSPFDALLEEVTLYRLPGVREPFVQAPLVGWAEAELTDGVLELIAGKEKLRAERYGKQCDVCWLVLVATGVNRKSMVDLSEFKKTELPKHGFARIYVYDEFDKKALLLAESQ